MPEGATNTCHASRGALLDFMIISRKLKPYLKSFRTVTEVPWSPHDGLEVELHAIPQLFMVTRVRMPKTLHGLEGANGQGLTWEQAKEKAMMNLERREAKSLLNEASAQAAARYGTTQVSEELA